MFLNLVKINQQLNKVKISQKGNKLYLRATLPSKPGDGLKDKQYDISTGLSGNEEGLKNALILAKRLETEIITVELMRKLDPISAKFDWTKWDKRIKDNDQLLVSQWLKRYEEYYWQTHEKTLSTQDTFNNYRRFFNFLPQDKALSEEILFNVLAKFTPNSRDRLGAYSCYRAIARFAGLTLDDRFKQLRGNYTPKKTAKIPTDEEIIECWNNFARTDWQWAYGLMAAYGLRGHEIFHVDLTDYPIVRVLPETKTGERLVYPIPKDWPDLFALDRNLVPEIPREGKSNKDLVTRLGSEFTRYKLPFTGLGLRHAYAIRCAVYGVDSAIASLWMGHSLEVHQKTYFRYIQKIAMDKIHSNLGK
jgi:hypothetical protein